MITISVRTALSLITLALFLASCGNDNKCYSNYPTDFNTSLANHLSAPFKQKDFAVYQTIDKNSSVTLHEIQGELIAPLLDSFEGSPVLNQGITNTCVTMSLVGAAGILLYQDTSYFNPICSLNLGNYLHYNNNYSTYEALKTSVTQSTLDYFPSGWDGSTLGLALAQATTFGLADNDNACGIDSFRIAEEHDNIIETSTFESMGIDISSKLTHETVCSNYEKSSIDCQCINTGDCHESSKIVNAIKSIIDSGGVVLISTVLHTNLPNYGLSKSHYQFVPDKTEPNVWAYNEETQNCRENKSAKCTLVSHDMIVFGYIDHDTNQDEGLLVLRNSWGASAGDGGNYYMTYGYAQKEVLEVVELSTK